MNSMSWEEYRIRESFVCKSCGQDMPCNCTVDTFRSNRLRQGQQFGQIRDLPQFKKLNKKG